MWVSFLLVNFLIAFIKKTNKQVFSPLDAGWGVDGSHRRRGTEDGCPGSGNGDRAEEEGECG